MSLKESFSDIRPLEPYNETATDQPVIDSEEDLRITRQLIFREARLLTQRRKRWNFPYHEVVAIGALV